MTDAMVAAVQGVARTWEAEAKERRRISQLDPIADTLEYCAGEISSRLKAAAEEPGEVTVDHVAKQHGVTPQTVRNWIRRNRLTARQTPKGYRISAGAKPVLRRRA